MTHPHRDIRSVKFYPFLREVAAEISARTADVSYLKGVDADPKRDESETLSVAGLRLALAGTLLYTQEGVDDVPKWLPSVGVDMTPAVVSSVLFGIAERTCFDDKATEADWRRAKILKEAMAATYAVFLRQVLQARSHELHNAEAERAKPGAGGGPQGYTYPIADPHPLMAEITLQRAVLPYGDPEKLLAAADCLMRLPPDRRGHAAAALLWLTSVPEELDRDGYAIVAAIVGETYGI